jgi:hypothetical protein
MKDAADALGSVAGATGVGTLCLLALFLFLDGRAPTLFPTFEQYAKTATWGIVAAVPVLAIGYVVGVAMMNAAGTAVRLTFGPHLDVEIGDTSKLANLDAGKSVLVQAFVQLRQERDVLGGAAIALLLLAVGALSEVPNLPGLKAVVVTAAIVAVLGAILLLWSSGEKGRQAHRFANAYATNSHSPSPDH